MCDRLALGSLTGSRPTARRCSRNAAPKALNRVRLIGLVCGSYSACHWTPRAKAGAPAMLIASIVPSSAMPSSTMRLPGSRMPCPCSEFTRIASQPSSFANAPSASSRTSCRSANTTVRIGMDLAVLEPRHAVVHAAGQLADLRMERAAERDIHLLQAAADAEQRHAALDAGLDQRQRHRVALLVVGLVRGTGLDAEIGRMDVGAAAGEQDAVDRAQQRIDVGDVGHPANINGRASATSATARMLRCPRPARCAGRSRPGRFRSRRLPVSSCWLTLYLPRVEHHRFRAGLREIGEVGDGGLALLRSKSRTDRRHRSNVRVAIR